MRGVASTEPVEAIGQPVEVEAAGQELPCGDREQAGEEQRKQELGHALGDDQDPADSEADYRKPGRRAPQGVGARPRRSREGNDRQIARGHDEARHAANASTFRLTPPAARGDNS